MDYISKLGGKNTVIRRTLLVILILITFSFQQTGGLFPELFGAKAMLLIPLTVCISMFEREFAGIFFGLLAGASMDAFSSQSMIFNSLFFTVAGFAAGSLITYLMRNNLLCAGLLTAVFAIIYTSLNFIIYYSPTLGASPVYVYFRYYFASAIFTVILTPVYYFMIRAISKHLK